MTPRTLREPAVNPHGTLSKLARNPRSLPGAASRTGQTAVSRLENDFGRARSSSSLLLFVELEQSQRFVLTVTTSCL